MASFGMLLPELPGYLETYDAGHLIGWIVSLFTVGAFFSRFFSGRIADRAGRKPVMLFGTAVTALAGLAYIGVGWLDDAAFAVQWLRSHGHEVLANMALAADNDDDAMKALLKEDERLWATLALKIRSVKNGIEERHNDWHTFSRD